MKTSIVALAALALLVGCATATRTSEPTAREAPTQTFNAATSLAPQPPIVTTSLAPSSTTAPSVVTPTTAETGGQTVLIFEGSDACTEDMAVTPVEYTIPDSADPIRGAFELLLASQLGAEGAAGMLNSVGVTDGLLTVNFEDLTAVMNNASTTCGSFSLLAVLNATAFQFPQVESVTYQIEGSCDAFFGWLQRECQEYARP